MEKRTNPLRILHGKLYTKWQSRLKARELCMLLASDQLSTVYFVLAPEHGNLGDHAIAIASEKKLHDRSLHFREISAGDLSLLADNHKLSYLDRHPIIINGGGNIGTLWPKEDDRIQSVIQQCRHSYIICLPSTAYYENSPKGEFLQKRAQKVFCRHRMLHFFARDESTYNTLMEMHVHVNLVPDMVLLLDKQEPQRKRNGCILCLRSDRERTIAEEEKSKIFETAFSLFEGRIRESDMNIQRTVKKADREQVLEAKFDEFRKAELVITDRLHGMLFAAITATPCIVLNSKSPKVLGCFSWVQHLGYIRYADSASEIPLLYQQIQKPLFHFDSGYYSSAFQPLEKAFDMLKDSEKQAI